MPLVPGADLASEDLVALGRIGRLAPGDFKVVRQKALLCAEASTVDGLIEALAAESAFKTRLGVAPIGFGARECKIFCVNQAVISCCAPAPGLQK